MRPPLVLLLVIVAVGAFFLAMNTGGGGEGDSTGVEADTGPPVAPPQDGLQVDLQDPDRTSVDTPTRPGEAPPRVDLPGVQASLGNALRGFVRLPDGTPLPEARVTLTRFGQFQMIFGEPSREDRATDRTTITRSDGSFEFRDVETYQGFSLIAVHSEHGRQEEGNFQLAEGETQEGILITLSGGVQLYGTVTDSGGSAVPNATLTLAMTSLGAFPSEDGPGADTRSADSSGNFEFKNVGEGNYSLIVVAEGYGRRSIQPINVTGEASIEQNVTLEAAHMIGGTVTTTEGSAVEGAQIQAFSMTNRREATQSQTTTDDRGEFLLDDVTPGTYTLLVRADGFKPEREPRVETGEMQVLVELTPRPKVTGRVLDASGQPVTSFTVLLRTPVQNTDATMAIAETRRRFRDVVDGVYELACPNKGEFVVEARAAGFAPCFSERFSIDYGQEKDRVDVPMTRGGTIRGRVLGPAGRPVAGARVKTHASDYSDDPFWQGLGSFPSQATQAEVRTNEAGDFEIGLLAGSSYQVDVRHADFAQDIQREIVVEEGRVTEIGDIRLEAGASLSGTIYGPSGKGLSGAVVEIRSDIVPSEWPVRMSARTNSEGRYAFAHVPAGSYKIHAKRQGGGNPFQSGLDVRSTERRVVVSDGNSYTEDFNISN